MLQHLTISPGAWVCGGQGEFVLNLWLFNQGEPAGPSSVRRGGGEDTAGRFIGLLNLMLKNLDRFMAAFTWALNILLGLYGFPIQHRTGWEWVFNLERQENRIEVVFYYRENASIFNSLRWCHLQKYKSSLTASKSSRNMNVIFTWMFSLNIF